MWHRISQQLSWKCSAAFAYEKNCCVNLLFFMLLLAYSLVIKLLGCSILSLCLGKNKKCIFWSSIQVLLILLQVVAILPLLIFSSLSLSFPGRWLLNLEALHCLISHHITICMPYTKLYHANSGKHFLFFNFVSACIFHTFCRTMCLTDLSNDKLVKDEGHKSFIAFNRRPSPLVLEQIVKSLTHSNPLTETDRWMQDCYLLWLNWSCLRDLVIVV